MDGLSMTIDVLITGKVFNAYGQQITGAQVLEENFGRSLIAAGIAVGTTPGQTVRPLNTPFDLSGAMVILSNSDTLTNQFIGRTIVCTAAITLTIPGGLSPGFSCLVQPPPSGNVTLAVAPTAFINGTQTALTRSLASNANGFAITPSAASLNSYLVSGS